MNASKKSKLSIQRRASGVDENLIKHLNFNNESEIIARYILEKLISYTITNHTQNEINNKLPDFYFDFYRRMFIDVLQIEFMAYDRDDMVSDQTSMKNKTMSFFDNKYNGLNDWSNLLEPKSSKIDRAASTFIKIIKGDSRVHLTTEGNVTIEKDKDKEKLISPRYLKTDVTSRNSATSSSQTLKLFKTTDVSKFTNMSLKEIVSREKKEKVFISLN